MEYVLVTQGLSKHYKSFKALDGLTMHVPKGSIYGFVGRNGAGKTTLIRLIWACKPPPPGNIPCTVRTAGKRASALSAAGWARWWRRRPSIWI